METVNQPVKVPPIVRRLVWLQVPIAIVAISISLYAGLQVRPLAEKKQQLQTELKDSEAQIEASRQHLQASRESVAYVSEAINDFYHNNFDGALTSYDKALKLDQNNGYILDLKGYTLFKAGRIPESIAVLEQAIDADATYPWSYVDLAKSYCAAGNHSQSQNTLKRALALRPDLTQQLEEDDELPSECKSAISNPG